MSIQPLTPGGPEAEIIRTLEPLVQARIRIEDLRRLSGGASRETWSFRLHVDGAAPVTLILRRDPPGRRGLSGSMAREAAAIRAAARAGLKVPRVLVDDDGTNLGTAGLIMEHVPGETIARRILRDSQYASARATLAADCGRFLAGLHRISPDEVPELAEWDPLAAYRERFEALGEASPAFDTAFRWLEHNRPRSYGRTIVHGDLRLGNIIVGPDGLRAAIDWELVHVGDPLEDLGWLCVKAWRFREPLPVGGFGTIEQLVGAYQAAGGATVHLPDLHWWILFNTLKWGIGCLAQASVHLSGANRSVELAAIGRRVCEQEWDLLELLDPAATTAALDDGADGTSGGGTAAAAGPQPVGVVDDGGLHGRPTVAELLEAAREYLIDEVPAVTDGRVQFHARVAANVLAIVDRQLRFGHEQEQRFRDGLQRLGVASARELGDAIAAGAFDDRRQDLHQFLAQAVRDKLTVANPRHLALSGRG